MHALTGIDPDRLREEKEREMTIDLGFAWLSLPPPSDAGDGAPGEMVGVVDVPGHIDFIKNMLAGIGGIDAAIFVVAADEGVMPQTREHLAILDLLEVPTGVIALTKVDAITEEGWLDLVEADVREALHATRLGAAPLARVSAREGTGLDELKQTLADILATAPPRMDIGRPRLPIDRAFSVPGFGTVVTGTLTDGVFRLGDEVELVPSGLKARIRGLQSHKKAVEMGLPGSRLAINLTGVHPDQLARGMVATRPGALRPTTLVDARLRLMGGDMTLAGRDAGALRNNQTVDFFCGAAETPAHVRLLDAEEIRPGETGWAQLRLEAPVGLAAGDRFIIRQPSPSVTVGGGQIVNAHPARRWRRFQPEVIAQLDALSRGAPDDLLRHAMAAHEPAAIKAVIERSGLEVGLAEETLAAMLADGQAVALGGAQAPLRNSATPVISLGGWRRLSERMTAILDDYHAAYPLRPGMAREELKSRLQGREKWTPRVFNELAALGVADGVVEEAGDIVRRPGYRVTFTPERQARVDALLAAYRAQPYTPPSAADSARGHRAGRDRARCCIRGCWCG